MCVCVLLCQSWVIVETLVNKHKLRAIDGKREKANNLFTHCTHRDFISTLQILSIYNKCQASPDDSAQKSQWLQWSFCQMTVSHPSNCSDIYIQWESSQCWLTCIGPNHCCRLWGLNCRHTKWETYWVMSNQVTHSSKSSACIAKKKKKTCNYKYTTYPLHLLNEM